MSVDCLLFYIDSPTPIMFFEGFLRICAVEMIVIIIIIIDALCAVCCCFVYRVFVILFVCLYFMCAVFSLCFLCVDCLLFCMNSCILCLDFWFYAFLFAFCVWMFSFMPSCLHFVCGCLVLCLLVCILREYCLHLTPLSPCDRSALLCAERTQQEIPLQGGLSQRCQPDCGEQQAVQW